MMMNSKTKKYIITDVDGTILDTMPLYTEIFCELMAKKNISYKIAKDYFLATSGTSLDEQIEGIFKRYDININNFEISLLIQKFFDKTSENMPLLFSGVKDFIKKMNQTYRLLFATSGSKTVRIKEVFFRYLISYDLILGFDEIPKGVKHIEKFVQRSRLDYQGFCSQAVYIGDGPKDMIIAKRNNIFAIGITNTVSEAVLIVAGADVVVKNIKEVLKYI